MEGKGGFGVVPDVDAADAFVASEGAVNVAQHHLQFRVLKFEAHEFECGGQLFFCESRRRLRSPAATTGCASAGWGLGGGR